MKKIKLTYEVYDTGAQDDRYMDVLYGRVPEEYLDRPGVKPGELTWKVGDRAWMRVPYLWAVAENETWEPDLGYEENTQNGFDENATYEELVAEIVKQASAAGIPQDALAFPYGETPCT